MRPDGAAAGASAAKRQAIRRILRNAAVIGVAPPAAVLGIRWGANAPWDPTPLVFGGALWVTLAMVFAAWAIARFEHR